jgi:hypothetical protein
MEARVLLQEGGVGATQLPMTYPILQQIQVPANGSMLAGYQVSSSTDSHCSAAAVKALPQHPYTQQLARCGYA